MRIFYLDRLKLFMTVLVIVHHTAIIYGAAGSWYYYEQQGQDAVNVLLSLFTIVNQSFFMGLFFFISGYMSPASYDRKGGSLFLKERLIRLGIPILLFMIVADPLLRFVATGYKGSLGDYFAMEFISHPFIGVAEFAAGPLWYLVALLLFSAGYAGFRRLSQGRGRGNPLPLTGRLIGGYLAVVIIANYLIRLAIPVGETVFSLQLAYFPAYIGLFMGGIAAYRGGWLEKLSGTASRRWGVAAVILIVGIPIGFILGGALDGDASSFEGGLSWQSAFYSAVDPVLGVGLSYMLLVWFRGRWNQAPSRLFSWMSANGFLVYVIHAIMLTYVSYGLRHLTLHPLLKFAVVVCITVPLCFAAASAIKFVPGAKKAV